MKINRLPLKRDRGDIVLLAVVTGYALFGLAAVFSASCYNAQVQTGDMFYYLKKQAVGLGLGFFSMLACCRIHVEKLRKATWLHVFFYVLSIVLLLLTFVPGIGVENYGAKRWLSVFGVTVQPSELAKYALVLLSAGYISRYPQNLRSFFGILPLLGFGIGVCIPVLLQPNMSVTLLLVAVTFCMIFIGGAKLRYVGAISLPAVCAVPALVAAAPYRLARLSAYLDPWASPKGEGYQLIQSLYALGNGGLFGVGFLCSRQKYRFLPFAESDFILSVIGEEFGVVGIGVLFLCVGFICYRCVKIALRCNDLFSRDLVLGITCVFALQTLLNGGVVSGAIPPTGIPLPLISAGNTSLVVTLSSFGVVYCCSRHNQTDKFHSI